MAVMGDQKPNNPKKIPSEYHVPGPEFTLPPEEFFPAPTEDPADRKKRGMSLPRAFILGTLMVLFAAASLRWERRDEGDNAAEAVSLPLETEPESVPESTSLPSETEQSAEETRKMQTPEKENVPETGMLPSSVRETESPETVPTETVTGSAPKTAGEPVPVVQTEPESASVSEALPETEGPTETGTEAGTEAETEAETEFESEPESESEEPSESEPESESPGETEPESDAGNGQNIDPTARPDAARGTGGETAPSEPVSPVSYGSEPETTGEEETTSSLDS